MTNTVTLFETINIVIKCVELYRTYLINNINIYENKESKVNIIKDFVLSFSNKLVYIIKFFDTENSIEKLTICREFLINFDIKDVDILCMLHYVKLYVKNYKKNKKMLL